MKFSFSEILPSIFSRLGIKGRPAHTRFPDPATWFFNEAAPPLSQAEMQRIFDEGYRVSREINKKLLAKGSNPRSLIPEGLTEGEWNSFIFQPPWPALKDLPPLPEVSSKEELRKILEEVHLKPTRRLTPEERLRNDWDYVSRNF